MSGIYVYDFAVGPHLPHGTVNMNRIHEMSLTVFGQEDTFLTGGPTTRVMAHLVNFRSLNEGVAWDDFLRAREMKVQWRRISRECNEAYLRKQEIKDTHRKGWSEVMDQMEEVALRPPDPDSDVHLLKPGGALYRELVCKYAHAV